MKTKLNVAALCLTVLAGSATHTAAQVSAFTYQGRLNLNGATANGYYDFMFRLLNDPTNGVAAPVIPINLAVPVTNGLFTTGMDFGAENFNGANRWLEINVRTNGGGPFTTLSARQLLTPTPYAIAANTASNLLGALPAAQLSGTILNASLPASPSFSGTVTANNFSGNGANLTNLDAATLDALDSSDFWRTAGNAGTTPGTHFVGTADYQPLQLRVNNVRALRLEPTANDANHSNIINLISGSPVNFVAPGIYGATIAGGGAQNYKGFNYTNTVAADFGSVGGGAGNTIHLNGDGGVIGGGSGNTIHGNAWYGTVAGGGGNMILRDSPYSTIGGGIGNTIQTNAANSVIDGGYFNTIEANTPNSTIGGGVENRIKGGGGHSVIAGGVANTIESGAGSAMIGGGVANTIHVNAEYATIAGGSENIVQPEARFATIPGGRFNVATGFSFAAGYRAKANNAGALVWGDSTEADIASTNANSVTMRASGGYRLFTDTNATTGAFLAAGSGSWTSMSDRNAKENFREADAREVLERVVALPVQTWNYKSQDACIRHIGPMAQDFKAAFGVGESETGIATVDADGVALAAIQGLNQKVENLSHELKRRDTENTELKQELVELKQSMNSLAHKLNRGAH